MQWMRPGVFVAALLGAAVSCTSSQPRSTAAQASEETASEEAASQAGQVSRPTETSTILASVEPPSACEHIEWGTGPGGRDFEIQLEPGMPALDASGSPARDVKECFARFGSAAACPAPHRAVDVAVWVQACQDGDSPSCDPAQWLSPAAARCVAERRGVVFEGVVVSVEMASGHDATPAWRFIPEGVECAGEEPAVSHHVYSVDAATGAFDGVVRGHDCH